MSANEDGLMKQSVLDINKFNKDERVSGEKKGCCK